jgi:ubiquinone/menaquinone biosynthesis C-methylase UbiE
METVRKYHNDVKRELIQRCVKSGESILDVGCGFGGDLHKWVSCGIRTLDMCDPSFEALEEARLRASKIKGVDPRFYHGDIHSCPSNKKYDTVCYNFSLHYIFANEKLFRQSVRVIRDRLKPGGKLIGVIPDSESILMETPFKDELGNFIVRKDTTGFGNFGEKIFVMLVDTPFYNGEAKSEPIAYKDILITELLENGFQLEEWSPLEGTHISRMYSRFIFVRTL